MPTSNFDCCIAGGSDNLTADNQDIPAGPKPISSTKLGSTDYQLPPPLSDRPTPISGHISPFHLGIHQPTHRLRLMFMC